MTTPHALARSLCCAAALAAAGCGAPLDVGTAASIDEQAATVCAHGATTFGVDVSEFQGNIDWGAAHASGVQFAVIRVGDGFYNDPKFVQNWNGAGAAGVLRGAYQFFRPEDDAAAEANHFADVLMANGGPGELPPVIDVEVTDGVGAGTYQQRVATWLSVVEQRTGVRPAIYTGKYFWQDNVGSNESAYPLWIAQWGPSCPDIAAQWGDWAFWQTSDNGQVGGIPAVVDTDLFNGSLDQLRALRADPQCVANPNTGGCNGSVVTACDNTGHLGSGDCGFFGATCSTEGGHPHCVHPYCTIHLGAEDGTFCNGDTLLDTCQLGQLSEGDCGAYGAKCSEEGGQGHCVHYMCWSHLDGGEDGSFCVDDTKIGSCALGVYDEGDCGVYGAKCSEEGGAAHCVHYMCWSNLGGAEDGSFCKDADTLGSCALGAYAETDCGADGCHATATGAQCGAADDGAGGGGSGDGANGGGGDGANGGGGDGANGGANGGGGDGANGGGGDGANGGGGAGATPVPTPAPSCGAAGGGALNLLALLAFAVRRRRR